MATSDTKRDSAPDTAVEAGIGKESAHAGSGGGSTALEVLRMRDFRYLFVANILVFMVFQMRNVVQAWLALELTDSQAWVGIIAGSPAIAVILLSLAGGVASDRWSKRTILMWVRGSMAVVNLIVGYLVAIEVISIWHLLALSMVQGGAVAFGMPASQTIVHDVVGRKRLLTAISLNQSLATTGAIIGPALGGVLLGVAGIAPVYFLIAVIYVPAVAATWRITTNKRAEPPVKTSAIADLKEAIAFVRSSPVLRPLIIMNILGLMAGFIFPIIPIYARDVLDVGELGLGAMMAAMSAGMAAGALTLALIGEVKRKGWLLFLSLVLGDPAAIAFGFSRDFYLSLSLLFIFGVSAGLYLSTLSTVFQTHSPDYLRGKIMSIYALTLQLFPLGWMIGGIAAQTLGNEMALVLGNGGVILVAWTLFFRSRALREMT
ncbi:MAG: MFS transporter [Chloroflexi bacterium]|nr:MFS transporter [Chloroflexota bacterium]